MRIQIKVAISFTGWPHPLFGAFLLVVLDYEQLLPQSGNPSPNGSQARGLVRLEVWNFDGNVVGDGDVIGFLIVWSQNRLVRVFYPSMGTLILSTGASA